MNQVLSGYRMKKDSASLSWPLSRLGVDRSEPLYFSVKQGPNGLSLTSAGVDALSLYQRPELLSDVNALLGFYGISVPKFS